MHSMIRRISPCAAICLLAFAAQAAPDPSLLRAGTHDQVVRQLAAAPAAMAGQRNTLDRTPSSLSWPLDPAAPLDAQPKPYVDESREYWRNVTAAELRAGVHLATSANGALIRFSPHAGTTATLDVARMQVQSANGRFTAQQAFRNIADAQQLHAAGMAVPQGSTIVHLDDAVGSAGIHISALAPQGSWLVHVYEPRSSLVLSLRAERDTVLAGDPVQVRASLEGGARLQRLGGLLTSPGGSSQAFDFARQPDGTFLAAVTPDARGIGAPGLWEIHAFGHAADGAQTIDRDARTAIAVSHAGARLNGEWQPSRSAARQPGIAMDIGVEVAVPSRYQLAGVLYGSDPAGELRPAAVAHSAVWLEPGMGQIPLHFDAAALAPAGLSAPYELRDLRLIDQAGMSLLERRERAVAID